MRMGAVFARGSCRALKWMALFGVVFALGVGSAMAQAPTVSVTLGTTTPAELGALVPVTVRVTPNPSATTTTRYGLTATLTLGAGTVDSATATDPDDTPGELAQADADVAWVNASGTILSARGTPALPAQMFSWTGRTATAEESTKVFYLRTYGDDDAENEKLQITTVISAAVAYTGTVTPVPVKTFTVQDNREQGYRLRHVISNQIKEGDSPTLELSAIPGKTVFTDLTVELTSVNDSSDYSIADAASTVTQSRSQVFRVPVKDDDDGRSVVEVFFNSISPDRDRQDDTVTLSVTRTTPAALRGREVTSLDLEVVDQHKLPSVEIDGITIKVGNKDTTVATLVEGQTGTLTLVADRGTTTDDVPNDEEIKVTLTRHDSSSAVAQDYNLDGSPVTIKASETTGTFTLEVHEDQDIAQDGEKLVLTASVAGEKKNGEETREVTLGAITFVDATIKKIEPRSDEVVDAAVAAARTAGDKDKNGLWTPSETLTLTAAALFDWPSDTTGVVLGNIQITDTEIVSATTTNDNLVVEAKAAGTAKVTVTATVTREASSGVPQTVSNVAQVAFDVKVDAPAIVAKPDAEVTASVAAAIKKAADMASSRQWEPGGATAMVPLSELFDVPESIRAIYDVESSDPGDVTAVISDDKMNVNLMPKSTGTAKITVTAVDLGGGSTSVSFDATVMAQAAVVGKSQAEVDAVFMTAGADKLEAGGPDVMVPMNELFTISPGAEPTYSVDSDMPAVVRASGSGTMAALTPLGTGTAMIMVTAVDSASRSIANVTYRAMVDRMALTITVETDPVDMVEEGSTIKVTATANRAVQAGEEAVVMLTVTGPAQGPDTISISAGGTMGEASVTVENDNVVDPKNDVVITAGGTAIDGGAKTFVFKVTEDDMASTFTLSGPEDMNLVEGREYTLTVTAAPAVLIDTEVMIMRDRSKSDADEDDYEVSGIMLTAGEATGTTTLVIKEDNTPDAGHGMPEMLVLYGMVDNAQTENSLSFYTWDMSVPALPVIAQLLLAAFLGVGGYRRYRRR